MANEQQGQGRKPDSPPPESHQFREFKGMNFTDQRTGIDDKEFYWMENAIPIGKGNVKILPNQGAAIATIAAGVAKMFGFTLNIANVETPVLITVNNDGSMSQVVVPTGATTVVAAAGSVTNPRMAIFKDTPILIIDPSKGYMSWDGTNFVIIDNTRKGVDIQVFEGRAWIVANSRTIQFTSPNTFNDFNATNGAGAVTLSDSAFPGNIVRLLSALEQLWIVGPGAVDGISNVQTTGSAPAVTTFSITNVVSNVGTTFAAGVNSFLRTFLFPTQYGTYAIVGATPQKLSDKLDQLWPALLLPGAVGALPDFPSAIGSVYSLFIWAGLVKMVDPLTFITRTMLICFSTGKWFLAAQGNLVWIAAVTSSNGQNQIWGTDGSTIYQIFGDEITSPPLSQNVTWKLVGKLWDFGLGVQQKELLRVGIDFNSANPVAITLTVENERTSVTSTPVVTGAAIITFVGLGPITFVGSGPITFTAGGFQLVRTGGTGTMIIGQYLGLTLAGTCPPFILNMIAVQIKKGGEWYKQRTV
jgi:hypothetical protein